ncbi:MAG: hypothetical protein CMK89_23885, partial [Pseudomonadales bacterium]|nr:hypothetical protein [Pseudomonadales bacterium]
TGLRKPTCTGRMIKKCSLAVIGKVSAPASRIQVIGNTGWHWGGHSWDWNAYYSHNHYLDQAKDALGFTYINEVGLGLEWDMHIKPLDWFGWRFLGLRAGYSFGDDVRGFNVGLSAR